MPAQLIPDFRRPLASLAAWLTVAVASVGPSAAATATAPDNAAVWRPSLSDSLQWILQGPVDTKASATVYDIDGFDNSARTVASLHRLGKHVVCYIDVGSWEDWRPDAKRFPASVLGKAYPGYPDERFLDIRKIGILGPIMRARFAMCRQKGFDAIEPDNIDTYDAGEQVTGFPLAAADELAYVRFLARIAHGLGLSIGQKNDPAQVAQLEPMLDWALLEECFLGEFCRDFAAYQKHGKRVFDTEYLSDTPRATFLGRDCPQNTAVERFALELKQVSLFAWRTDCSGRVTR